MSTLAGRALITGASSGIGEACAGAFARKGHELVLVARRLGRLSDVAARLVAETGVKVATFALDVRERAAVERWAAGNAELLAGVDVLVNNAGLARGLAKIHEGDPDDWDEMIDTNVKGLLYVSRQVIPHLVAKGRGHVVNIGSVAGRWTYPNGAAYCASKAAERVLTEGMRMDLCGTGVRVTTVDPGLVKTEFSLVRFHGDAVRAESPYKGMTALTAEDVASVVAWVVDQPPHVTVAEVVLYPTDQASPTQVHRRS